MNKRQKKKLKKRDGHFHYKNYHYWKRVWELAENKYGKEIVEAWKAEAEENKTGYKRNMMYIITNRKLWPINVTLLRGVYPGNISDAVSSPLMNDDIDNKIKQYHETMSRLNRDFDGDTLSILFLDNKEEK